MAMTFHAAIAAIDCIIYSYLVNLYLGYAPTARLIGGITLSAEIFRRALRQMGESQFSDSLAFNSAQVSSYGGTVPYRLPAVRQSDSAIAASHTAITVLRHAEPCNKGAPAKTKSILLCIRENSDIFSHINVDCQAVRCRTKPSALPIGNRFGRQARIEPS